MAQTTQALAETSYPPSSTGVQEALVEALSDPEGGEVALRSGEVAGWIHVRKGVIVWAHVSSAPATIDDIGRRAGVSLDSETVSALREECRTTATNFMDVLVRWRLIDEDRARDTLRDFISERVEIALDLPHATAMFVPRARAYNGPITLRSGEIPSRRPPAETPLEDVAPVSGLRAVKVPSMVLETVQRAMTIDGVLGAAVLDRASGEHLFRTGADIDSAILRSHLRSLEAMGPDAEEAMACAGPRCVLARPLLSTPELALFAVVSVASTPLGLARSLIARVAAGKHVPSL